MATEGQGPPERQGSTGRDEPSRGGSGGGSGPPRVYISSRSGGEGQGPPRRRQLRVGEPYDPEPLREETRSWIAKALVWLLIAITIGLLGLEASGLINIEEAKDLALAILGPLIAVTGTVFGFYYGGHRRG